VLQRRFRAVPGVIDVTGWGGKTKTYELQVDFNRLVANGLTLPQVLQAVSNANINVGGNTVNIGAQSAVVRGVGLIRSIEDLSNTMVSQSGGKPGAGQGHRSVTVGEKRGSASRPRPGRRHRPGHRADAARRAEFADHYPCRAAVASINNSSILPPGVKIERIYDRKDGSCADQSARCGDRRGISIAARRSGECRPPCVQHGMGGEVDQVLAVVRCVRS